MKISKRMLAVFLAVVLAVSMGVMSFAVNAADDDIVLNGDETGASSLMIDTSTILNSTGTGYRYLGFATLKDVDLSVYKYLQLTYTGDVRSLRLQFENTATGDQSGNYWFDSTNEEGSFKTADGSAIPLAAEEPATVVIDFATSGVDLTMGYNGLHIHYKDATESTGFVISDARLKKNAVDPTTEPSTEAPTAAPTEAPTEAPVVDYVILDGDETGASSMIFDSTSVLNSTGTGYRYLGFVTLKETNLADYKYLQLTYTGDVYTLRLQFENVATGGQSDFYWFNGQMNEEEQYIQPIHFVTADGSEIPLNATEPVTIVIDLEASGIDLTAGYDGIHMHYKDPEVESTGFVITNAMLTKSAEIIDPNQQPTTEPTTEETTATEPTTDKDGSNPQTGVAPVLPIAIALAASAGVIVLTAKKRK